MLTARDQETYNHLVATIGKLKFHHLKKLITLSRKELQDRYPRNHKRRKRGNIDPSYTPEEYERFLKYCNHHKARLAIKLTRMLGLRIGEVVPIKIEHIDFIKRLLYVHTEKADTEDVMPLHDEIFFDLRDWVNEHHRAILSHGGYILWSDNPVQKRQHISKDWLRGYYARVRKEAGLDQTYGVTTERTGRKPRRLFIKVPHSGRHTFGTDMWRSTGDPKIVQKALRQQDIKSTEPYIHVRTEEVHQAINQVFSLYEKEIEK